jgi:hypothetical protein
MILETVCTSETLVDLDKSTRSYNPVDSHFLTEYLIGSLVSLYYFYLVMFIIILDLITSSGFLLKIWFFNKSGENIMCSKSVRALTISICGCSEGMAIWVIKLYLNLMPQGDCWCYVTVDEIWGLSRMLHQSFRKKWSWNILNNYFAFNIYLSSFVTCQRHFCTCIFYSYSNFQPGWSCGLINFLNTYKEIK